jgi:RNA polymerase sigma-70 factor (ECF subfamily)
MKTPARTQLTRLLHQLRDGDREAAERVAPLVYDELHGLAAAHMRGERAGHTLQATGLVHEAWARLVEQDKAAWETRSAFFAMSSKIMRHVLVRHALARGRKKRGGGAPREAFEIVIESFAERTLAAGDFIDLHEALERLATIDERAAGIVDLRFFGGMTVQETADILELSTSTVESSFRAARAWLRNALASGRSDP